MQMLCLNSFNRCIYQNVKRIIPDTQQKSKIQIALEEGFEAFDTAASIQIKYTDNLHNVREIFIYKAPEPKVVTVLNNKAIKINDEIHNALLCDDYHFRLSLKKFMYFRLCEGFENPSLEDFEECILINRRHNITAAVVDKRNKTKKLRSVTCQILVAPENHSSVCKCCLELKKEKMKLLSRKRHKSEVRFEQCVGSNHRYLSRGDLMKRLKTVSASKTSLEKKIKRMKEKMEKEALLLNADDTKDMKEVFEYADTTIDFKGNENMKILWECQREALNCKDPRQHRWHPR